MLLRGAGSSLSLVSVAMLTTQYRMHPQISHFPARRFYDDALRDVRGYAHARTPTLVWPCILPRCAHTYPHMPIHAHAHTRTCPRMPTATHAHTHTYLTQAPGMAKLRMATWHHPNLN